MGLFKDFKEDFSQAVNEMMPGTETSAKDSKPEELVVNTLGEDVDVKKELSKLDGLLEQVKKDETPAIKATLETEIPNVMNEKKEEEPATPEIRPVETTEENKILMNNAALLNNNLTPEPQVQVAPTITPSAPVNTVNLGAVADETSVITAGTVLTGDLASDGSFDIQGTINGNISCNGKLVITGTVNGNSAASEIFADVAKIEGEVTSTGTVKVGAGSVIIGNIAASSAVIAGAVKGDIDVQGPVVVDTSAVIMGNIKSRSVQINNGAVIEGFCSQCYADVDVQGLFDGR